MQFLRVDFFSCPLKTALRFFNQVFPIRPSFSSIPFVCQTQFNRNADTNPPSEFWHERSFFLVERPPASGGGLRRPALHATRRFPRGVFRSRERHRLLHCSTHSFLGRIVAGMDFTRLRLDALDHIIVANIPRQVSLRGER